MKIGLNEIMGDSNSHLATSLKTLVPTRTQVTNSSPHCDGALHPLNRLEVVERQTCK